MSGSEDCWAENERLHREIRSLNGQIEGLTRAMAGLRLRIERLQRESETASCGPDQNV